jgi:hypothetical protein
MAVKQLGRFKATDLYGTAAPPRLGATARIRDASAGAPGELRVGYPVPNEGLATATPRRPNPSTVGGVNPEGEFADRGGIQLTGRDQAGRNWGATIYSPQSEREAFEDAVFAQSDAGSRRLF